MSPKSPIDFMEKPKPHEGGAEPERESTVRLGKSKIKETKLTFGGYRQIMKVAQDGRSRRRGRSGSKPSPSAQLHTPRMRRPNLQLVAVRLTYARNKGDGNWYAHGRYLERESATGRNTDGRGFGHEGDDMPIAKTLDAWQKAEDRNVFKLIISPEHGDRLDLRDYTKDYLAELEKHLGTRLQWVAADHYNTDDDHVHVAIRGRDEHGRELRIPPEFIKGPLREVARDLATQRLGHRSEQDVVDARERQIPQHRFTDLDRALIKQGRVGQDGSITVDFGQAVRADASDDRKQFRLQLLKRLATLESLGLAERGQGGAWVLDGATESILRERQKANDRLKVLHSHRAMVSDPRIPLQAAPKGNARIAGRLIGTGLDDATGKAYMLLESTRGSVIYLYQTIGAETARGQGLQPGDYLVVTQREQDNGQGRASTFQTVRRVGPADAMLSDPKALREEIRHQVKESGRLPERGHWQGWLGAFHGELNKQAQALLAQGVIRQSGNAFEYVDNQGVARPKGPRR